MTNDNYSDFDSAHGPEFGNNLSYVELNKQESEKVKLNNP